MILLALLMCIGLTSSNKDLGETGGVSAAETAVHVDVAVVLASPVHRLPGASSYPP